MIALSEQTFCILTKDKKCVDIFYNNSNQLNFWYISFDNKNTWILTNLKTRKELINKINSNNYENLPKIFN